MPFNGSGVFNRVYNWVTDKNNSVDITASRMDTEDTGFATGLSLCLTKDGQQNPTANLPMNGFAHTGVGDATVATQYGVVGQIQNSTYTWVAAGGTADAITASYSPSISVLVDGMELDVRTTATNTTTIPNFSPDGLTARTIIKNGGALAVGDMPTEAKLRYELASTQWTLMNPVVAPGNPFSDASALIKNSSDATKLAKFSAASITTATTRTLTIQDKNYTIADNADLAGKAPIASPTFTGTPAAPTAANGTNTTQVATTEFSYGAVSKLANGYVILSNGLMVQWGTNTGSSTTISLPTSFANACLNVFVSSGTTSTSTSTGEQQNVTASTTTNFTVTSAPNANGATGINFIAIGY